MAERVHVQPNYLEEEPEEGEIYDDDEPEAKKSFPVFDLSKITPILRRPVASKLFTQQSWKYASRELGRFVKECKEKAANMQHMSHERGYSSRIYGEKENRHIGWDGSSSERQCHKRRHESLHPFSKDKVPAVSGTESDQECVRRKSWSSDGKKSKQHGCKKLKRNHNKKGNKSKKTGSKKPNESVDNVPLNCGSVESRSHSEDGNADSALRKRILNMMAVKYNINVTAGDVDVSNKSDSEKRDSVQEIQQNEVSKNAEESDESTEIEIIEVEKKEPEVITLDESDEELSSSKIDVSENVCPCVENRIQNDVSENQENRRNSVHERGISLQNEIPGKENDLVIETLEEHNHHQSGTSEKGSNLGSNTQPVTECVISSDDGSPEDDDLLQLRMQALRSNKNKDVNSSGEETKTEEDEVLQLRLEALRSAYLKKHMNRKQRGLKVKPRNDGRVTELSPLNSPEELMPPGTSNKTVPEAPSNLDLPPLPSSPPPTNNILLPTKSSELDETTAIVDMDLSCSDDEGKSEKSTAALDGTQRKAAKELCVSDVPSFLTTCSVNNNCGPLISDLTLEINSPQKTEGISSINTVDMWNSQFTGFEYLKPGHYGVNNSNLYTQSYSHNALISLPPPPPPPPPPLLPPPPPPPPAPLLSPPPPPPGEDIIDLNSENMCLVDQTMQTHEKVTEQVPDKQNLTVEDFEGLCPNDRVALNNNICLVTDVRCGQYEDIPGHICVAEESLNSTATEISKQNGSSSIFVKSASTPELHAKNKCDSFIDCTPVQTRNDVASLGTAVQSQCDAVPKESPENVGEKINNTPVLHEGSQNCKKNPQISSGNCSPNDSFQTCGVSDTVSELKNSTESIQHGMTEAEKNILDTKCNETSNETYETKSIDFSSMIVLDEVGSTDQLDHLELVGLTADDGIENTDSFEDSEEVLRAKLLESISQKKNQTPSKSNRNDQQTPKIVPRRSVPLCSKKSFLRTERAMNKNSANPAVSKYRGVTRRNVRNAQVSARKKYISDNRAQVSSNRYKKQTYSSVVTETVPGSGLLQVTVPMKDSELQGCKRKVTPFVSKSKVADRFVIHLGEDSDSCDEEVAKEMHSISKRRCVKVNDVPVGTERHCGPSLRVAIPATCSAALHSTDSATSTTVHGYMNDTTLNTASTVSASLEFEKSVDMLLKQVRSEKEAQGAGERPFTEVIKNTLVTTPQEIFHNVGQEKDRKVTVNTQRHSSASTPLAVRFLPSSRQEEYRRLKEQLALKEKQLLGHNSSLLKLPGSTEFKEQNRFAVKKSAHKIVRHPVANTAKSAPYPTKPNYKLLNQQENDKNNRVTNLSESSNAMIADVGCQEELEKKQRSLSLNIKVNEGGTRVVKASENHTSSSGVKSVPRPAVGKMLSKSSTNTSQFSRLNNAVEGSEMQAKAKVSQTQTALLSLTDGKNVKSVSKIQSFPGLQNSPLKKVENNHVVFKMMKEINHNTVNIIDGVVGPDSNNQSSFQLSGRTSGLQHKTVKETASLQPICVNSKESLPENLNRNVCSPKNFQISELDSEHCSPAANVSLPRSCNLVKENVVLSERGMSKGNDSLARTVQQAQKLEETVRAKIKEYEFRKGVTHSESRKEVTNSCNKNLPDKLVSPDVLGNEVTASGKSFDTIAKSKTELNEALTSSSFTERNQISISCNEQKVMEVHTKPDRVNNVLRQSEISRELVTLKEKKRLEYSEDNRHDLHEAENRVLNKRYEILEKMTALSYLLRQIDMVKSTELECELEVKRKKEELQRAEMRLATQKKIASEMRDHGNEARQLVKDGLKEYSSLCRICQNLGQQAVGMSYKLPEGGLELMSEKMKLLSSQAKKLNGRTSSSSELPVGTENIHHSDNETAEQNSEISLGESGILHSAGADYRINCCTMSEDKYPMVNERVAADDSSIRIVQNSKLESENSQTKSASIGDENDLGGKRSECDLNVSGELLGGKGDIRESELSNTKLIDPRKHDAPRRLQKYVSPLDHINFSSDVCMDPNTVLCPYELRGTCNDDECSYQHQRSAS